MKTRVLTVMLVVLTLVAAFAGALPASAQAPSGAGVVRGEVTAVDNSGFTLDTLNGRTAAVTVTRSTRYRIPGIQNPSLAGIEVGMVVQARGTWSSDNTTFTAQTVVAATREVIRQHLVRGKVTAVDPAAGTLALKTPQSVEWTIHTTDQTRYRIPEVQEPTLVDVKVGDQVLVFGRPGNTTGEATAREGTALLVTVLPEGMVTGRGQVTAISGNALTVETWLGSGTVTVDAATRYRARDIANPSLSDIKVGTTIAVVGVKQSVGNVLAKTIGILNQGS
jgi:Domain of unknown function (DUF5666)